MIQWNTHSSLDVEKGQAYKRLEKWQIHRVAQQLLPNERIAFCMKHMQSQTVQVMYSPQHQNTYYKGLIACGSVWVCPICSVKIAERRRLELEQAIKNCIDNGGMVLFATYTVSHKKYDTLADLLSAFLAARQRMRQGRAAIELRKKYHILGTVSVREVTWSEKNGWHPHCHELIFCAQDIDAQEYEQTVRDLWKMSANHYGLQMNQHGFQLDRTHGGIADYIAKFGREPARKPWGSAEELTKSHFKVARQQEHLTPFGMLARIAQGDDKLKSHFLEYAQWFKGKRQLVWSPGLRDQLLKDIPTLNDEDIAQQEQEPDEDIVLGILDSRQWMFVLKNNARGMLLEVARTGQWIHILTFLEELSFPFVTSPPD